MDEGMVERVAKVIHERVTLGGTVWQDHIPVARAAIEVMREPTIFTTHSELIFGAVRLPPGTYQICKIELASANPT